MQETAEFFRELAMRHRRLARTLHNEELMGELLRLADECETKADALAKRASAADAK